MAQKSKKPHKKWILWITVLAAAALLACAVILFQLPYLEAESQMSSEGGLVLQELEDGQVRLSWPEAPRTDYYLVEFLHWVTDPEAPEPQLQVLTSMEVTQGTSCILPQLPQDEELTIRVNTMIRYEIPGDDRVRPGTVPVEACLTLVPPRIADIQWTPDPAADTVMLEFSMPGADEARLFQLTQTESTLLRTLQEGSTQLQFGQDGDFPVPAYGETVTVYLDAVRAGENYVFTGYRSQEISVVREDLLGRDLELELQEISDNIYTLTWNETKGETYLVQTLGDSGWVTLAEVDREEERTYTTGQLAAFADFSFRVIARGGQVQPGGINAAMSGTEKVMTDQALLYTTIWPLQDLTVYSEPQRENEIGTVKAGCTLCIVEDAEGSFGIRYVDAQTGQTLLGYIDSNYCLIDLREYLGELCGYEITNSYSSRFKVNKYSMSRMTGTQIAGYENVRLQDGTYLVPLLYPVANRLLTAARSAQEQGYRLKIYDAYRPNRATNMLYNRAEELLEEPVPGDIPNPKDEELLLTYADVMTDFGKYPLTYFLAKGYSKHNSGLALDLTLEVLETGQEVAMQSNMHDLSYYSMIYRNNQGAKALSQIMKDAGFDDLVSEWWHFEDNETRAALSPKSLWGGVSVQGWKLDPYGWRYRNADGTYYTGQTLVEGEITYSFDSNGYLIEE